MRRLYITPIVFGPSPFGPVGRESRHPKYARLVKRWSMMDFGDEPFCLFMPDVGPAEHSVLIANADVIALPEDLRQPMSVSEKSSLSTLLEQRNIPADFVSEVNTYEELVREIKKIMMSAQRLQGVGFGRLFEDDQLGSRVSVLSLQKKEQMREAAQSIGVDVKDSDDMRKVLNMMRKRWKIK